MPLCLYAFVQRHFNFRNAPVSTTSPNPFIVCSNPNPKTNKYYLRRYDSPKTFQPIKSDDCTNRMEPFGTYLVSKMTALNYR